MNQIIGKEVERDKKAQELLIIIGSNIKERRIKKGMTQLDLADAVGSIQDHISKVEAGKINITIEYLARLSDALGVSVKYFFK